MSSGSAAPQSVEELEELLSRPSPEAVEAIAQSGGDLMLLGVGGKMGPTMARMAQRAAEMAGTACRIIGVSRFSSPEARSRLEQWGIETISCDLLDEAAVSQLPEARNIISMVGFKFGASSAPAQTWAVNCYLPALVARKFHRSRIVAFSTGNVYAFAPVDSEGPTADTPPLPVGEYGMSALGRERIFEYFCSKLNIPTAILRLNYATELRYGVLVDLAQQIWSGQPLDLSMSYVNVIWLGDANTMTLAALAQTSVPAHVMNLSGPKLCVRDLCERMGELLDRPIRFTGQQQSHALLNDGRAAYPLLGAPQTTVDQMLRWTADWIRRGGARLDKPTHFQVRDGQF